MTGYGPAKFAAIGRAWLPACVAAVLAFTPAPNAAAQAPATLAPAVPAPAAQAATPQAPAAAHEAGAAQPAAVNPTSTTPAESVSPEMASPAPAAEPATKPVDLSPLGMFLNADPIVKAVMIGLAFASLVTWTLWLGKSLELWLARRAARADLRALAASADLDAAHAAMRGRSSPVTRFVEAAREEEERSAGLGADGVKERVAALLPRLEAQAGRKVARGTAAVATIGSTAPFIGLFGTVWGIMDSFIGISKSHTTNLAVVAPGIAEALLATAMGLVAAIPAVMIYNMFARSIAGYRALLGDAASEALRHVSRDLDRAAAARDDRETRVIAMRRPAE